MIPTGDATAAPRRRKPRLTERQRDALAVGAILLLAALPLRGLLRNQGPPMEEGFMLVFPERVLKGDLANRDFLHLYGPGSLWALAAAFKAFGARLEVERLFALVQQVGVFAGVFALSRRWGRTAATLCGAISLVIIMPPIGLTALAWVGAVAFGLWGLVFGLRASLDQSDPRARRRMVVAGALFGFALLFRLDLVLAIGLSGLVLWRAVDHALRRRLLAGLALGASPYLIHIATAGPGTVFRGMVLDPVVYLRGGRRLPIPPPPDHLAGFLQRAGELRALDWPLPTFRSATQLTIWFFFLIASIAALLLVARSVLRADRSSFRGRVLLAVGLFSLGILPQALQRTDSTHFAWVSCVPVALLPLAIIELTRGRAPRWAPRTHSLVAGASALAFLALVIPRYTFGSYADYVLQSAGIHRQAFRIERGERGERVFYYGRPDVAAALKPLIHDLDAISKPGQTLFVGTADLRKTPYSDAFLYYLFPELPPATYYIEMDPGVANADDSGLADEVRDADFLVLSRVWDDWDEPNDSRVFGSNEPNDVVDREFCLVGDYEALYELYRHCDA